MIYVSVNVVSGLDAMKKLVMELKNISEDIEFSSVYRQFETEHRYDYDANMISILKMGYAIDSDEMLTRLASIHTKMSSYVGSDKVKMIPLAIENQTRMLPELTLPHPLLHSDPLVARCAAEVWGNYNHPILNRSLSDLANQSADILNAEFMLQGKSLVAR